MRLKRLRPKSYRCDADLAVILRPVFPVTETMADVAY